MDFSDMLIDFSDMLIAFSDHITVARQVIDEGGDPHRETAALLFSVPVEEVSSEMRQVAKCYNMTIYRAICRCQG